MAEVQIKQDFDSYSRNLQHTLEALLRIIMRFVPPRVKAALNSFYKNHLEGIRAVQNDGPTKELEKITNLSYEEMVETMAKCQKDDVAVIASEFKKGYQKDENGNYIVDDELGNKKSVSKMKSITKANRKIQSYTKFQSKYNILNGFTNRKISKWNEVYDKAINRHEGARYNLIFNKRQVGYMADRIADIKSKRIGITKEEFYNEHPEAKEAVEKAIEKGLDLNTEELGEWAKADNFYGYDYLNATARVFGGSGQATK